ncbi:MAG: YidH family protein [Desulfobaccales bacterium]
MAEATEKKKTGKLGNLQVHMANERTFLAWVRTSIGIMAFGFVVEKFALFIDKLSYFLGKGQIPKVPLHSSLGYSSIFGIMLVAMGALMGALSFVRYKKVEREIDDDTYQPSLLLDIMVTMGMLAIGIFLVFYMIHSVRD